MQASFYLQYILTNGLLAKGVAFLKIPGAAIFFLLSKCGAPDPAILPYSLPLSP